MIEKYIIDFLNNENHDLRITRNGRWIDQKCTPDVLWSISDFVLNYVDTIKNEFTVADIWKSDYAKQTIADTYSKPNTNSKMAENEYDKVFSQPLNLLCYAGIIKDISNTNRHLYIIENRQILEYIAINEMKALRFLQLYIEKVLKDSEIFDLFENFFNHQDKSRFNQLKSQFIDFYHKNTSIQEDYEPKRIFTKILNPLAHKYNKCGSKKGRMSKYKIKTSDIMYNQDNFRDVYENKPKDITRKEWLILNPQINIRSGFFEQKMNRAKKILKKNICEYRNNISELTQFCNTQNDMQLATQIHHIFPKNEFSEIMHYIENLIALTPNQHFGFAHPNNNTQTIDLDSQKIILICKTCSIKENLLSHKEEHIYSFTNLLYVLSIGWSNQNILDIEENDYISVLHAIDYHYANI